MKKIFLTHLTTLLIATCIFISCSKDDSITAARQTTSLSSSDGKMAPPKEGGSVSGVLSPDPLTSDIAIYKDGDWLLMGQTTDDRGSFMIGHIPAGVYYLRIRYSIAGEAERVKIINNVTVIENQNTNLGTITLQDQ